MTEEYDNLLNQIRTVRVEREAARLVDEIYKMRDARKVSPDECMTLKGELIRVCHTKHIPTDRVRHKIALGTGRVNLYKAYIKYNDIYVATQRGITAQAEYDAEIKVREDWRENLSVEIVPEDEKDMRDEYKLRRIEHQ